MLIGFLLVVTGLLGAIFVEDIAKA